MTTGLPTSTAREVYDQWHERLEVDAEADALWHQMIKARLRPTEDLQNRRILDIGCGRGGFACWLARHEAAPREVVGCDFSGSAVEKAKSFAKTIGVDNMRWYTADIQSLSQFQDGEFDTITSTETVEHVPDPLLAISELARVLKPGGRLYLTTPNYFSTIGLLRLYVTFVRRRKWDECGQPIVHWTMLPRTRRWISAAGLRIIETNSTGHYLPFPGRPPIRVRFLESPQVLMKWLGLHSLIVAEKRKS